MTDQPARVHHPGVILQRELEARSWSQQEAAQVLGVSAQYINDLVRGRRSLGVAMALRLEKALGASAEMWLSMQMNYDLWVERNKA